jgi:hypothetical protein
MADLFSKILDSQFGGLDPAKEFPRDILLSSQYVYTFQIGNKYFNFFDIDSISKTLKVDQKKTFKPYGYTHPISLTSHSGWDIRITGKKANDGILEQFLDSIIQLNNDPETIYPKNSKPYGANPTIDLIEQVYSINSTVMEEYTYKELVLTGFDQDVSEDNSPITYTLSFFAKNRINGRNGNSLAYLDAADAIQKSIDNSPSYKYEGPATKIANAQNNQFSGFDDSQA